MVVFVVLLKGVLPLSASNGGAVRELFVPESRLEQARSEAENLPCVEINQVGSSPLITPSSSWEWLDISVW